MLRFYYGFNEGTYFSRSFFETKDGVGKRYNIVFAEELDFFTSIEPKSYVVYDDPFLILGYLIANGWDCEYVKDKVFTYLSDIIELKKKQDSLCFYNAIDFFGKDYYEAYFSDNEERFLAVSIAKSFLEENIKVNTKIETLVSLSVVCGNSISLASDVSINNIFSKVFKVESMIDIENKGIGLELLKKQNKVLLEDLESLFIETKNDIEKNKKTKDSVRSKSHYSDEYEIYISKRNNELFNSGSRSSLIYRILKSDYTKKRKLETNVKLIIKSGFFDFDWYLVNNPDVRKSKLHPVEHYLEYGWLEGRDPSAEFNTNYYLLKNKDVSSTGMNPLLHYVKFGKAEGRKMNDFT